MLIACPPRRPEKDHRTQVNAFAILLKKHPALSNTRLVLIGGCRNEDDEKRVEALQALATELGIIVGLHLPGNKYEGIDNCVG